RVDEVLELVQLSKDAHRRIATYSGGMKQRLGLAQAFLNRPQVLLLDEPCASLDPLGRHEVLDIIADLEGKSTVFMSTHILADVERVCDRVGIIERGKLVVEADRRELLERYAAPTLEVEFERGSSEGPVLARLVERLSAEDWAGPQVSLEGMVLRVAPRDVGRAKKELLPLVLASGLTVARYQTGQASLEDVFLRLVGSAEVSG
ncbi:MAG: ABC transporter ATP-binding protein, partial [Chloroflexota bacterium]|nr:ABC transporter ATP-binding protein [Chloroflexota bacterium]